MKINPNVVFVQPHDVPDAYKKHATASVSSDDVTGDQDNPVVVDDQAPVEKSGDGQKKAVEGSDSEEDMPLSHVKEAKVWTATKVN